MSTTPEIRSAGGEAPPPAARKGWVSWLEQRLNLTEMFSFLSHFAIVYTPVDTRRPIGEVLREMSSTPIASYVRWPQVLGILTALLFGLEACTGVLLTLYYHPTVEGAYRSTRTIVRDVPVGWFVHEIHVWGAYLLVAVVVVRLLRLFWDGLYRAPRELLWLSSVALAWLVLQLDFTGRALVWDVQSYWATMRGLEVVWAMPIVGPVLSFLLGGRVLGDDVLLRAYVLHVIVLPILYLLFVYLTFATMRRIGLSASVGSPDAHPTTSLRRHVVDLVILMLLLFAGLVTLSTLLPFRFLGPADPYATPAGTRPPWYLLASYTVLRLVPGPSWIPGFVLLVLGLAVPLLPLLARADGRMPDEKTVRRIGFVLFGLWVALTIAGLFVERR